MIEHNIDLRPYNTFGISVKSSAFARFSNLDELRLSLKQLNENQPLLILGGGSNLLFTQDFNGLTLKNEIKGVEIVEENEEYAIVKAGAGENWHQFVLKTIDLGLAGLENLSLIPGNVGASPMQNIGAYGREIKDVFFELEAYHIATGEIHYFDNAGCEFGYRESVFKNKFKGQYIIISVSYKLNKKHDVNTSYGAIEAELSKMGINNPTIKDVSNAVISIRSSKLPNPAEIGNAGSFFKNPVVPLSILEKIEQNYENVPNYPAANGHVKLAAGWLIEQAGWKGKTMDNYGVHKLQALVLVNYGGAKGKEIFDLSSKIMADVKNKFGVELEREVNIL